MYLISKFHHGKYTYFAAMSSAIRRVSKELSRVGDGAEANKEVGGIK